MVEGGGEKLRCHAGFSRARAAISVAIGPSRFLGRGCDEALFREKRLFSEKGGGNPVNWGLIGISTAKAIQ